MSDDVNIPEDAVELLARASRGRAWDVMGESQRRAARAMARDNLRRHWPVMLATLSGFTIEVGWDVPTDKAILRVEHRCGWGAWLPNPEYLANIIDGPVAEHRRTGCAAGGTL